MQQEIFQRQFCVCIRQGVSVVVCLFFYYFLLHTADWRCTATSGRGTQRKTMVTDFAKALVG